MDSIIRHIRCPVCGSQHLQKVLSCKDHLVSNEWFDILECDNCSLRFTQNVPNPKQIGRYYQSENYVSHSDSEHGLINKLYKTVRRFTLKSKRKLVAAKTGMSNGRLLDIGCGTGAFLDEMKKAGWQVTGLEPDEGAREKAMELYGIKPLPPESLYEFKPNSFDAITLWHVLEHVHDLQGYMAQIKKLLTPAGRVFIAVPNYESADAEHYENQWAAYDVPRHLYHFSPGALKSLTVQHGLKLIYSRPMLLDAFYISWLSEKYKGGKAQIAKACLHGTLATLATFANPQEASSIIYVFSRV